MGKKRPVSSYWIGNTFHIETPHAVVNIRTGLTSFEGNDVDSIEVIKDQEATFPDSPKSKAMNIRIWQKGEANGSP